MKPVAHRPSISRRAAPGGLSDDIFAEAIRVWQPHSKKPLNREDAREIVENMSGFFRVLREWAEEDRRADNKDHATASFLANDPR